MIFGENKKYVPTLAVRPSEMNAVEQLPNETKNAILPCFLLAPWVSSKSLTRTIERIEKAYPKRPYILDIDRDYSFSNFETELTNAQSELAEILDPSDGFANWLNFIEKNNNIIPCIQTDAQSENKIKLQIDKYNFMERNYCFRIVKERIPPNIDSIILSLKEEGTANYCIMLEGGWSKDASALSPWFHGIIDKNLNRLDGRIPIIISSTSSPKEFSKIDGIEPIRFSNRQIFDTVSKQFSNRSHFIFGDWGSTRPREKGNISSKPLDRIDYPTKDAWYIARSKENKWTFLDAAKQIINNSEAWHGNHNIWGEEMIKRTIIDPRLGINTTSKNIAARINIHLHIQAHYGVDIRGLSFDEDWED